METRKKQADEITKAYHEAYDSWWDARDKRRHVESMIWEKEKELKILRETEEALRKEEDIKEEIWMKYRLGVD